MNIISLNLTSHLRTWHKMVLKSASRQKRPSLPGKRPFGSIYNLAREGLKYYGYYDKYNLRQYDPQVYVDKYTYKPQKRLSGYAWQLQKRLRSPKRGYVAKYYQFNQEQLRFPRRRFWYEKRRYTSKSSQYTTEYSRQRRVSGVRYQSNIRYN